MKHIILPLLLFFYANAHAGLIELIATPTKEDVRLSSLASSATVLHSYSKVTGVRALFEPQEQGILLQLNKKALASSLIIRLEIAGKNDLADFQKWIRAQNLPLQVELRTEIRLQSLESEQWGFFNTAQKVPIELDDLTTIELTGKAGEDIHSPLPSVGKKVRVAVLDTGIDFKHPNLISQIHREESECEALQVHEACLKKAKTAAEKTQCEKTTGLADTNQNGYPLDCSGWNTTLPRNVNTGLSGSNYAQDDVGHGTHVAGIIAAALVDGDGVRGVSPEKIEIIPVKVIRADNSPKDPVKPRDDTPFAPLPSEKDLGPSRTFVDFVAKGMLYAIRSGAQVMNLSLGWPAAIDSPLMRQMVQLSQELSIPIVAAAGNDSTDYPILPCLYEGVICVGAYGPDGAMAYFSNFGSSVDIAAPGLHILSTWPMDKRPLKFTDRNGFEFKRGTSMAAPFVTGAIARLLSEGMSSQEAVSRLILGARPHQVATLKTWQKKYTLSGNLDIQQALRLKPRPLIHPLRKSAIRIFLDESSGMAMGEIKLKNVWMDAEATRITVRDAKNQRVITQEDFQNWKSGEIKKIILEIPCQDVFTSSEVLFEVQTESSGFDSRTFPLQGEIQNLIHPALPSSGRIKALPIAVNDIPSQMESIRSITLQDGTQTPEYLITQMKAGVWNMRLLKLQQDGVYHSGTTVQISTAATSLLQVFKLDVNSDQESEYIAAIRADDGALEFHYLKNNLTAFPFSPVKFASRETYIPDNFQWIKFDGLLLPAWSSMGSLPENEKQKPDPWNPKPKDPGPAMRIYILTTRGLKTVPIPENFYVIGLIPKDNASGVLEAILSDGKSFMDFRYFLTEIRSTQNSVQIGATTGIPLSRFRLLEGLEIRRVTALNPAERGGVFFSGMGVRGTQRITLLESGGSQDFTLSSPNTVDSIRKVIGLFRGQDQLASFSQSQYDLVYQDHVKNQTSLTSMRRFSFLPKILAESFFFPISVNQLPALYLPGVGASGGIEIIMPNHEGQLIRPARLRLEPINGCEELNFIEATVNEPARAVFFCKDKLLEVNLSLY